MRITVAPASAVPAITLPLLGSITGAAGATESTVVLAGPLVLPAASWATALTTVPLASGVPGVKLQLPLPSAVTWPIGLAEQIERQLRQLDLERHAPLLSPALAMLEENNLERFQAHARQVLEARTWLARLNPLRLLRRGRLRRFLREHGEADDDSRLAALLGACDLVSRLLSNDLGPMLVMVPAQPQQLSGSQPTHILVPYLVTQKR